ncbi:MAG: helix-turn-helix domain-containing protein [Candidatus Nanohaloarchaea archaeon]|nr:helix-turn-helix domain-containing protein [Candidatus Nanohaloarchaea archaeon]
MRRDQLVETVKSLLDRQGWRHSYLGNRCFDLFARGEDESLILKVHENVDSADRKSAQELKQACMYLGASPLIVGEKRTRDELEDNVVYERYGVPAVSRETLKSYIEARRTPMVLRRRGGYYVSVNPSRLEERRKEEGYSLNALAKELGVSRRTVARYREGGDASMEKARRLDEVLGEVFRALDLTDFRVEVESSPSNRISRSLVRIGFDASGFSTAPFDAAARDDDERFVAKDEREVEEALIGFLRSLQELSSSRTFIVTEREEDYGELPSVTEERLEEMDGKDEFKEEVR